MARELLRRRSDTKVLTNELLSRFPEFDDLFIGLDVLGGKAVSRNTRGIRDACKHLAAGCCMRSACVVSFDLICVKMSMSRCIRRYPDGKRTTQTRKQ